MTVRIDVDGAMLVVPDEDELAELAGSAAAPGAVLPAEREHFVTWLADRTPDDIAAQLINRVRANRDLARGPGWTLDLAILVEGRPVGIQSLSGFDGWPATGTVGTASWLLAPLQGRGLGMRSRAAVLELAFARLRADCAKSWVLEDNRASVAVSTRLGYEIVDRHEITERGVVYPEFVFQLERDAWLSSTVRERYRPTITCAEPLAELLPR